MSNKEEHHGLENKLPYGTEGILDRKPNTTFLTLRESIVRFKEECEKEGVIIPREVIGFFSYDLTSKERELLQLGREEE